MINILVMSHGYGDTWDTWSLCGCCGGHLVKWSIYVKGYGRRWLSLCVCVCGGGGAKGLHLRIAVLDAW